mmetsp:Transcript_73106/g.221333  ORF Transcript_73106/g.221333 Transcript_73106/m.221333 type:complete len:80 (-) Transcript_73106:89-328(-)
MPRPWRWPRHSFVPSAANVVFERSPPQDKPTSMRVLRLPEALLATCCAHAGRTPRLASQVFESVLVESKTFFHAHQRIL